MKRTKRKCPECGTEFFGTTGSVLCPACQKSKIVSSTIRERTCIICGRTFDGGPRAKRCPECRILVRKENAAKYRKSGPMRPLGSIDYCKRCGKEYVVRTGRQKYCSYKCAQISVKEWQSEHKKTKYNPEKAKKQHTESRSKKIKICRYCGKSFWDGTSSNVCSDYCRKKQLQIRRYEADIRRGCNCDLQKLLDERELYREKQKKSAQQRTLVTPS